MSLEPASHHCRITRIVGPSWRRGGRGGDWRTPSSQMEPDVPINGCSMLCLPSILSVCLPLSSQPACQDLRWLESNTHGESVQEATQRDRTSATEMFMKRKNLIIHCIIVNSNIARDLLSANQPRRTHMLDLQTDKTGSIHKHQKRIEHPLVGHWWPRGDHCVCGDRRGPASRCMALDLVVLRLFDPNRGGRRNHDGRHPTVRIV